MNTGNQIQTKTFTEKRTDLKTLSKEVKPFVKRGHASTINEAIIDFYRGSNKGTEFKTFKEWAEHGYSVKKGEKALLVWGKPKVKKQDNENDGYSFFPVAYVFSDLQVVDNSKNLNVVGEPIAKYGCAEIQVKYKKSDFEFAKPTIRNSSEAYQVLKPFYTGMEHRESFYVLFLNHGAKPIGVYCVSIGGVASTIVDIRIVFQVALKCNATSIIVSHNHPSGNTKPSEQDLKLTNKLKEAGTYLDIPIRDHLILTESDYYSFADEGQM